MNLSQSIAFVTGANRGLGRELAIQLLARGAKVYAGVRNPGALDLPGVIPVQIDLTDPGSIERAAKTAGDVTVVINNAGIYTHERFADGDLDQIHQEMDVNYLGTLRVIRAFAPAIEANGGGTVLNILSVLSWSHPVDFGPYAAAKAAAWAMSNALRDELKPRGIAVSALHVGFIDTDMVAHVEGLPKNDPVLVAEQALNGIAEGRSEILADALTQQVKAALSSV
jgi:NAD(P)-dependent dehydrogenase (short-subunit alcohol dehydrogenase family)